MLVLSVQTEIPLAEPSAEFGFVTWLDVSMRQFDGAAREPIGRARVALIHSGEALNNRVAIHDVLLGAGDELLALYDVFFDDEDYLAPAYANGAGLDVLYFAEVAVAPAWRGRRIEEAIVHRLTHTWGQGCAIAVVPVADDVSRWLEMGFQQPEGVASFVFLDLSLVQPEVVAVDEDGHTFAVRSADTAERMDDGD